MSNMAMARAALPQHLQALEQANRVRLARADLKRRVGRGESTAKEILLTRPWQADNMPVNELLTSQRRWGRMRCKRLLTSLGIPENKRIGTLTDRQREVLTVALEQRTNPGADGGGVPAQLEEQLTPA